VGARKIYTVEHGGLKRQHKEGGEKSREESWMTTEKTLRIGKGVK